MLKIITVTVVTLFSFFIAAGQDTTAKMTKVKIPLLKSIPLYLVNGIEVKQQDVEQLNSNDIEKINVLKDSNAVKKYGTRAINGVIEIILKKEFIEKEMEKIFPKTKPPVIEETDGPAIFSKVEISAYYKGNIKQFIQDNLKPQLDAAGKKLTGTVRLQFIVNINGTISDIKVDNHSDCKIEQLVNEAIRVIKLTNGNWVGAEQNGRKLENAFHNEYFVFK